MQESACAQAAAAVADAAAAAAGEVGEDSPASAAPPAGADSGRGGSGDRRGGTTQRRSGPRPWCHVPTVVLCGMNTDGFCMSGAGRVSHEGRRVAAMSGQFAVPVGSAGAVACIAWEALNQAKSTTLHRSRYFRSSRRGTAVIQSEWL